MTKQTTGTVISAARQWWLKVNTKAVRMGPMDGATFPHIIKVRYNVGSTEYIKRKWINAGVTVPAIDSTVTVAYSEGNPKKAKIV